MLLIKVLFFFIIMSRKCGCLLTTSQKDVLAVPAVTRRPVVAVTEVTGRVVTDHVVQQNIEGVLQGGEC